MSYGKGKKVGNFLNNCLYKTEKRTTREERKQNRWDNTYSTLHGRDALNQLSDHERKSRGDWY